MIYQNDINDILDIWEGKPERHEVADNPWSERCRHCGGDTAALFACCDGEASEREHSDWCPDEAAKDAPCEVEA